LAQSGRTDGDLSRVRADPAGRRQGKDSVEERVGISAEMPLPSIFSRKKDKTGAQLRVHDIFSWGSRALQRLQGGIRPVRWQGDLTSQLCTSLCNCKRPGDHFSLPEASRALPNPILHLQTKLGSIWARQLVSRGSFPSQSYRFLPQSRHANLQLFDTERGRASLPPGALAHPPCSSPRLHTGPPRTTASPIFQ
jgi:hypothetical protein